MARGTKSAVDGPAYTVHMGGTRGNPPGLTRPRGNIEALPSGSLRVRVYAGVDILTGTDLYLRKTIPAGPTAQRLAEDACEEFIRQVEQGRQPKTNASLLLLIEEHLKTAEIGQRTKETLEGYVRKHIASTALGGRTIGEIGVQQLESFYAELRRCRDHCDGRPQVRHYTQAEHTCTRRCRRHSCKSLARSTIRKIHFLISAAYQSAIRWEWISTNPAQNAKKPAPPAPDPQPPTAEEAAAQVNECWRWGDLGPFAWVAMTTGARRGELCALRWENLQCLHAVRGEHDCIVTGCRWILVVRRAIAQTDSDGYIWEKDTKTHQRRHVALDPETVAVLAEHRQRCEQAAREAGFTLAKTHYMFPASPEGTDPRSPRSMSERYKRCATRLGIATTLKCLRHYSATELITGGVDIRTVAGRLGHGGGGTTTLKVYAAWVSAADQHASQVLMARMPQRPVLAHARIAPGMSVFEDAEAPEHAPISFDPRRGHEKVAARLFDEWQAGELCGGTELTVNGVAESYRLTRYAAHQVITHLKRRGVLEVRNGNRSVVLSRHETVVRVTSETVTETIEITSSHEVTEAVRLPLVPPAPEPRALVLELLHLGTRVRQLNTRADPTNLEVLEKLMLDAVQRTGGDRTRIGEYELAVLLPGQVEPVTTVVVAA